MQFNRGFQTYQNVSVMTAPPERLLLMLYEALGRNIRAAKQAMTDGDIEYRRTSLRKARDIVAELMSALNFDVGGEIAENLHQLYRYVTGCLINADVSVDTQPLECALNVVDILNDAWIQAVDIVRNEQTPMLQASAR